MNTENKRRFEIPELEIVSFSIEDIIVTSGDFGDTNQGANDVFPKPNNPWW